MAEKILLVDVDSKIPNLALMKISAFHKLRGDEVGWKVNNPDKVYASVVYKKNKWKGDALQHFFPEAEIKVGGLGYSYEKLPQVIEFVKPDYDLYPDIDYSLGFTSRGCIRNCYFCEVPRKEGNFQLWQHPIEFHDSRFNKIKLLDNNILANKQWFFKVADWILKKDLKVDFNQGLDIRLIDSEIAERIALLKHDGVIKFAFDNSSLKEKVKEGIKLLYDFGIRGRQIGFYVYCHDNSQFNDALYRCNILRDLGVNAFVMFNIDKRRSRQIKDLQRWANRRWLYWKTDFEDYKRGET